MDKNAIKKYAAWARRELISRVSQKAEYYGVTAEDRGDINADSIDGRVLSADEKKQRQALIRKVRRDGYEQAMEEAAYTWFNRFSALRYMEANNYLPSRTRVFTNAEGEFKPQILDEAIHLEMDGLDMKKVYMLKEANETEALYRYLLITQCNALSKIMPVMFQKIDDYTQLLLPDYLLRKGSVIEQMVTAIPEEDWTDQVQIIGWLYQYYNSEKKDEVFAALKKNVKITKENIPAATQLFTPDWIVRYMVENSLGRLWIEGHPNDELKSSWKYYLDEAEQEPEVEAQLAEIRKEYAALKPEDILCIDPCAGSGHILVYMFDVLMQIYTDYGYTTTEAVRSIVENNLYGLDIDDRAAQLANFSVMMKARSYDRRFLTRKDECGEPNIPQPHVYAIAESNDLNINDRLYFTNDDPKLIKEFGILSEELYDAKEYGSILNVSRMDFSALYARIDEIRNDIHFNKESVLNKILPMIQVAEALAQKYDVVCTNPPYMGNNSMSSKLSAFVKKYYNEVKMDLFSCFIDKVITMTKQFRFMSMITMESWMFLSSYEVLRKKIGTITHIKNLVHMPYLGKGGTSLGISFGTASFVFCVENQENYKAKFMCIRYYETNEGVPLSFPVVNEKYGIKKLSSFNKIASGQIAYWASQELLDSFVIGDNIQEYIDTFQGIITGDNSKFLRFWFELDLNKIAFDYKKIDDIPIKEKYWIPYNKGGEYKKWYGNQDYVINWKNGPSDKTRGKKTFENYYLQPYVSWSYITSSTLACRFFPAGFLWDVHGSGIFDKSDMLFYLQGLISSKVGMALLKVINSTISYQVENIAQIPVILEMKYKAQIEELVKNNIAMAKSDWDMFEQSWNFKAHPLIGNDSCLKTNYENWCKLLRKRISLTRKNESEITNIFAVIYKLSSVELSYVEDRDITVHTPCIEEDVKTLISYAVGCMFGRYSLDVEGLAYAGGEWDDSKYNTFIPDKDDILPVCDDEYFEDDIVNRFVDFVRVVYGEDTLEENLRFIADALGGTGSPRDVIRNYFINDFYKDHCKVYQKRPIYWLFDSGKKNSFKCLIYMHRYKPDTIARIRTDYVHEQQARYRTAIEGLKNQIANAAAGERVKLNKKLKKLQDQADELHSYEEKIHHLADRFISIDLDDGVKHNYEIFKDVLAKIK